MVEHETITLSNEEVKRIANELEMLYERTAESEYTQTAKDAARDAMELRKRAGIDRNPELIEDD